MIQIRLIPLLEYFFHSTFAYYILDKSLYFLSNTRAYNFQVIMERALVEYHVDPTMN